MIILTWGGSQIQGQVSGEEERRPCEDRGKSTKAKHARECLKPPEVQGEARVG